MPLISFEKYLREVEGVHIHGRQGRRVVVRCGDSEGPVWAEWDDDHLFSITGSVVEQLRTLYPGGDGLESSPLVQVVHATSVDSMLGGVDIPFLVRYLKAGADAYYDYEHVSAVYDYAAALEAGGDVKILRYYAAESLHHMATRARQEDCAVEMGSELPFATESEFMSVICGALNKSLRPPAGGQLPPFIIQGFMAVHPDAVERDGCLILSGGANVIGIEALGLVGDSVVLGPRPAASSCVVKPSPPKALRQENPDKVFEAASGSASAKEVRGAEVSGVEEGMEHVEELVAVDPNNLPPREKEEYEAGFVGGRFWMKKLNRQAVGRCFKDLTVGEHQAEHVIAELSRRLMRELGPQAKRQLNDSQLALMAGSLLLLRKGNWKFHDNGVWERCR